VLRHLSEGETQRRASYNPTQQHQATTRHSDTNSIFHLRQLDEFIRLTGVPKAYQLAVPYRSIVGHMSKLWVETARRILTDYEAFKKAFLNTWWSASQQNLVKCSSNLSLSGHFLKYATMASHLEPRSTEMEVIEARRYFSIVIKKGHINQSTVYN
jgi:hypothetical protein